MPPFNPRSAAARREYYGVGPRVNPPPASPRTPRVSPQQWAQNQAQRYIDAQIKAIQESQRIYTEELQRQAQERIKQGQALAAWMQGMNFPGRIQSVYGMAGNDITGYAKGFSGDMQNIANADAAEQTNMLSGTGQEGAVRNEGEGMGNVLYGAYGWSPAKSFAETGAAYGADAALQPAFAAQIAAAEAAKGLSEGLAGTKDFALQMAEARAGKGQLVQELLDNRLKMKWAAEDRKQAQDDARFKRYIALAALAERQGKARLAEKYYQLAYGDNKLAKRKQRVAELAALGYGPDGKTLLPGWKMGPNGQPVYKGKPGTQPAGGKNAPNWGSINTKMMDDTDGFYDEVKDPNDIMGGTIKQKWSRERAYKWLFAKYGPSVKDKNRLRAMINRILDGAGFPRPTGGR